MTPFRLVSNATHFVAGAKTFQNDTYRVTRYPVREFNGVPIVHLSLSRLDRGVVVDWREKQFIKNQLVGEECEAVEIFPAESRKVDTANQFHLWVCADPKVSLGIGFFDGRNVSDKTGINGCTQRSGSGATSEDESRANDFHARAAVILKGLK